MKILRRAKLWRSTSGRLGTGVEVNQTSTGTIAGSPILRTSIAQVQTVSADLAHDIDCLPEILFCVDLCHNANLVPQHCNGTVIGDSVADYLENLKRTRESIPWLTPSELPAEVRECVARFYLHELGRPPTTRT